MIRRHTIPLLFMLVLPNMVFAAGDDCGRYKIVYTQTLSYQDPLGEVVTRDQKAVTKDNVTASLGRAVKMYGSKFEIRRDYTAENLLKLMSPQDRAFLAKTMRGTPSYNAYIKYNFNKFSNGKDLSRLFNSCNERINLQCDSRSKTCEVKADEITCDPKGYLFEDLTNSAEKYDISVKLHGGHFYQLIINRGGKGDILNILANKYKTDNQEYPKQNEVIEKLASILPETPVALKNPNNQGYYNELDDK